MTRSFVHAIAPAAGLAMLLAAAPLAQAQDKTFELKLSHWVPPSHPLQKAMEEWGADVEKASGGTIKYKMFPSQQLGKAFDHYDMARDGIADFVYVNPGYQPGRFPIIAAGELPFLIGNAKDGGNRAVDDLVPQVRGERDEGRALLLLLHPRSADLALEQEEDRGAGRHQGHEGAAVARHRRGLGDAARRHQRAGERDRSARRSGEGRGRSGDLPVGLGAAARRRQGHQVSHGRAARNDRRSSG